MASIITTYTPFEIEPDSDDTTIKRFGNHALNITLNGIIGGTIGAGIGAGTGYLAGKYFGESAPQHLLKFTTAGGALLGSNLNRAYGIAKLKQKHKDMINEIPNIEVE